MHNGLKTVLRRRTQESWPGLWRGTHADQIWYLGLVLPNEAPIVAFLFTPARLEPSQLSFCCRFTLFYQRFHCSEGAGVGPDCQATAPNQGTPEPASCLAKDGGFFLLRVSIKIPVLQGPWLHRTTRPERCWFDSSEFIPTWRCGHLLEYQPGFKWVPYTQRAAGRKMARHTFHSLIFLARSALCQLVWEAGVPVWTR